jgi:zinc protease
VAPRPRRRRADLRQAGPGLVRRHALRQRLPIGKPEIITKGSRDAALRFYRDWYRPDLMAVIVVGDVTPDAIVPQVERLFGDLTNPTTARPRPGGGALAGGDVRIAIDTDAELRRTSIELSALFPRRRESHRSDYRRFVIDGLYHQMFGARLAKLARRPDAPFVMAFSSTGAATREFESAPPSGIRRTPASTRAS